MSSPLNTRHELLEIMHNQAFRYLRIFFFIAESPIKEEDSTNIIAESEEADQNDLKDIVTSTLSKKFKDLEVSVTLY